MPSVQRIPAHRFSDSQSRKFTADSVRMLTASSEFKRFEEVRDQTENLQATWIPAIVGLLVIVYLDGLLALATGGPFLAAHVDALPVFSRFCTAFLVLYPLGWCLLAAWSAFLSGTLHVVAAHALVAWLMTWVPWVPEHAEPFVYAGRPIRTAIAAFIGPLLVGLWYQGRVNERWDRRRLFFLPTLTLPPVLMTATLGSWALVGAMLARLPTSFETAITNPRSVAIAAIPGEMWRFLSTAFVESAKSFLHFAATIYSPTGLDERDVIRAIFLAALFFSIGLWVASWVSLLVGGFVGILRGVFRSVLLPQSVFLWRMVLLLAIATYGLLYSLDAATPTVSAGLAMYIVLLFVRGPTEEQDMGD